MTGGAGHCDGFEMEGGVDKEGAAGLHWPRALASPAAQA